MSTADDIAIILRIVFKIRKRGQTSELQFLDQLQILFYSSGRGKRFFLLKRSPDGLRGPPVSYSMGTGCLSRGKGRGV
jgi:hypothetical protein